MVAYLGCLLDWIIIVQDLQKSVRKKQENGSKCDLFDSSKKRVCPKKDC